MLQARSLTQATLYDNSLEVAWRLMEYILLELRASAEEGTAKARQRPTRLTTMAYELITPGGSKVLVVGRIYDLEMGWQTWMRKATSAMAPG